MILYISFDNHSCTTIYNVSSDQQPHFVLIPSAPRESRSTRDQRLQRSQQSSRSAGFQTSVNVVTLITPVYRDRPVTFTIVPWVLFRPLSSRKTSSAAGAVSRRCDFSAERPEVACQAGMPPGNSSPGPLSPTVSCFRWNLERGKQDVNLKLIFFCRNANSYFVDHNDHCSMMNKQIIIEHN